MNRSTNSLALLAVMDTLQPTTAQDKAARVGEKRERDTGFLSDRDNFSDIFKQHNQMHRISGRGDEIEFQVEAARLLVLCMNREGADTGNIGRLQRAEHRIP